MKEKLQNMMKRINLRRLLPKALMVLFAATFCFSAVQIVRNVRQADKRDELYQDLSNVAVKPAEPKPDDRPDTDPDGTTDGTTENADDPAISLKPGLHMPGQ